MLVLAHFDERRAFALRAPDFEGVGLDAEQGGGFFVRQKIRVEV